MPRPQYRGIKETSTGGEEFQDVNALLLCGYKSFILFQEEGDSSADETFFGVRPLC